MHLLTLPIELYAMLSCLEHILTILILSLYNPIPICSDALAALLIISKPSSSHFFVALILTLITTSFTVPTPITLHWVPGYRGILVNEDVDNVAKQALSIPSIPT